MADARRLTSISAIRRERLLIVAAISWLMGFVLITSRNIPLPIPKAAEPFFAAFLLAMTMGLPVPLLYLTLRHVFTEPTFVWQRKVRGALFTGLFLTVAVLYGRLVLPLMFSASRLHHSSPSQNHVPWKILPFA